MYYEVTVVREPERDGGALAPLHSGKWRGVTPAFTTKCHRTNTTDKMPSDNMPHQKNDTRTNATREVNGRTKCH